MFYQQLQLFNADAYLDTTIELKNQINTIINFYETDDTLEFDAETALKYIKILINF